MVTQKMISLKIDVDLLENLDRSLSFFGSKRNTLINCFIRCCLLNLSTFQVTKILAEYYDLYKPSFVDGMIIYKSSSFVGKIICKSSSCNGK